MRITNCPNCGAPLSSSGECRYCGTVVSRDDAGHLSFRVTECNVRPVTAGVRLHKAIVDYAKAPDNLGNFINKLLAEKLANELLSEAVTQQSYDPRTEELCVRARLLVADGKRHALFLQEDNYGESND